MHKQKVRCSSGYPYDLSWQLHSSLENIRDMDADKLEGLCIDFTMPGPREGLRATERQGEQAPQTPAKRARPCGARG